MGNGRVEGSLAIWEGGQAAISLTPDVDGTSSDSLLDSILFFPLEKTTQWCLGSSLFSCHRWHCSTGLHSEQLLQPSCTVLHLGAVPQKLTVPPQIKKMPLPFPASWISSVLQLLFLPLVAPLSQYFHFCFHCYCLALLSATSYITAAFMLASGYPGLEIKILYYCTVYSTVQ